MIHGPFCRAALAGLLVAMLTPLAGCGPVEVQRRGEKLYNSLVGVQTIVVAPAMNLSTSSNVNITDVTNAMASELGQVEGVNVVPLGRVVQYLADNKLATVGSPEEARELARVFGAQATIVMAVTEYDPYNPPRMGLAVQMYTAGDLPAPAATDGFDPVAASRSAAPFAVGEAANRPRDMISRVYSGRNAETEILAKRYSRERMADDTPYGWRRFLVDQSEFQRLCCYGIIREMMGEEGRKDQWPRINVGSEAGKWPK